MPADQIGFPSLCPNTEMKKKRLVYIFYNQVARLPLLYNKRNWHAEGFTSFSFFLPSTVSKQQYLLQSEDIFVIMSKETRRPT